MQPRPSHQVCRRDKQKPRSFFEKMHNYEPYAIEEAYTVLISEYHHTLCEIKEYFQKADKGVVLGLIDDKSCKMLRVETTKESEDREKFPDPRTSTDNIITGTQALSRLAAMPLRFITNSAYSNCRCRRNPGHFRQNFRP